MQTRRWVGWLVWKNSPAAGPLLRSWWCSSVPPLGVTTPEAARAPGTQKAAPGSSWARPPRPLRLFTAPLGGGAVGPSSAKLQGGPFLATPETRRQVSLTGPLMCLSLLLFPFYQNTVHLQEAESSTVNTHVPLAWRSAACSLPLSVHTELSECEVQHCDPQILSCPVLLC